jgi:ABC-type sugar transport system permease subunit
MLVGANFLQQFWFITLPSLRYTFLFLSITGVSGAVMVFTQIYIMTGGGPLNSTTTVMADLFSRFIHLRLGEANAIGVIVFLFLLVFSILNLRISRESGE